MRRLAPVLLASLSVAACALEAPVAGRACGADSDCGDASGYYCQLEVEPHVCLPLPSGVPAPPNHAPVVESALIVIASAISGEAPVPVQGTFRARDLDGDAVSFATASLSNTLGSLVLSEDGSYTFTPAQALPTMDSSDVFPFEVFDDREPAAQTQGTALVYLITQPPSAQVKLWRGEGTDRFDDDSGWEPAAAPTEETTALVGPGARGPLRLDDGVTRAVSGWLTSSSGVISLGSSGDPATLLVHGTRLISSAALAHGTVQLVSSQGFNTEVTLVGELPSLVVETDVRLAGAVHARGDLLLKNGKAPLRVGSLVVDGDLTQQGDAALVMAAAGETLVVGGDLSLTGAASRLEAGLLVVGGDIDVTQPGSVAGPSLRVLLTGERRGAERPQSIRLATPEKFRFLDVVVARDAAALFETDAHIDEALTVLGAIGVAPERVVEVDTLILRPSTRALSGPQGELHAGRCLIATRVEVPSFISCDHVVTPVPEPEADAGVVPPEEPDAGPPSACAAGTLEQTNDLVSHNVIVASADPPLPAEGTFETEATAFTERTVLLRTGQLDVDDDGAVAFTPSGVAGHDEAGFTVERDSGAGLVASDACADVYALDTQNMNVLVGLLWDDPASWSRGRLPTPLDAVFLPPSAAPYEAAPSGGPLLARELWVGSGAILDTLGRELHVGRRLVVGGELRTGAASARLEDGGEVAGRIQRLACASGMISLVGDVSVQALISVDEADVTAACGFDLGRHRFTVAGDATLDAPLALHMQLRPATFIVAGRLQSPGLTGVLERGEIQLRGDVDVGEWTASASLNHQLWIMSPGELSLPRIDYDGWLLLTASDERLDEGGAVVGDTPLVLEDGGSVGLLTSYRTINVTAGQLVVDTLQWTPLFGTNTPERWQVSECTYGDAPVCPVAP